MEGPVAISAASCCRWLRVYQSGKKGEAPVVLPVTLASSAWLSNSGPLPWTWVRLECKLAFLFSIPSVLGYLFNLTDSYSPS